MAQMLYILVAMFGMMIFLMTSQRGIERTNQKESLNEVSTQLTGVGTELLERIGRAYYDRYNYVNSDPADRPYCGRVMETQPALFTDTTAFNTSAASRSPSEGGWIEGFDGLDTTLTRGGFAFDAHVEVRYVADGGDLATGTFSKEVEVEVTNPDLYLGDDPTNTFSVTMTRVFTYGCTTDPNYVPYVPPLQNCPPRTPRPCMASHGA